MKTYVNLLFAGVVLFALLSTSRPAAAALISVQFHGHLLPFNSSSTDGLDITGVFGPPNTYLSGDAYSGTILYDTALAPADLYPANPAYGQYEHDFGDGSSDFLSIAVTINGHTETVIGDSNYERADIGYSTQDSVLFATSNHGHVLAPGAPFDESYADFFVYSLNGQHLVPSDALPTSVDLTELQPPGGAKIGDLIIERGIYGAGTNTYTAETDFLYLGLDSIDSWSALPAPEPSALALLAAGLLALSARPRRASTAPGRRNSRPG